MTGHIGVVGRVLTDKAVMLNQRVGRFEDINTDAIIPDYLFQALQAPEIRERLVKLGYGAAQPNISPKLIASVEIPLPPLETQHRIASILGAYDDLIEVNRRRIAVLEEMARGLFEEWFVRFRFPGHEAVPILDTQDGPLPEGWTWGTLADIGQASGKSLNPSAFPDETFAHYSLPAFDGGRSPVADQGSAIKSNKLHFDEPVVLVSKLNPRIPRVWFVPKTTEVRQLASTEFVPIKSNNGLPLAYVFAIVSGEQFRNRLVGMAGGTSTSHQRVKPKDILGTPVALAPRQLVMEAGEHLSPVYRLVVQLEAANRSLAASRDLLLPRLISGQLSVAEAERELEEAA